jgi:hypothetical protein
VAGAALAAERRMLRASIALEENRVLVAVGMAGKGPYIFMIDTGGVVSLVHDTLAKTLKLPIIGHSALGGEGPISRIVRAPSLALGGLSIDRPLVMLSPAGTESAAIGDGIGGLALIRRFNLSIDARARTLWVQPSRQPAVTERYGLSGLWFDRKGDVAEVAAVGTGSPAAEAGMQVGDRVVGAWEEVLRSTNHGPGTAVTLDVDRKGAKRAVSFTCGLICKTYPPPVTKVS